MVHMQLHWLVDMKEVTTLMVWLKVQGKISSMEGIRNVGSLDGDSDRFVVSVSNTLTPRYPTQWDGSS